MPTTLDAEIRAKIDSFLSDISVLVKEAALQSVHAALTGDAAPASRSRAPRGRPAKTAPSAGHRGRRSSEELAEISTKVLDHVSANPGLRLEQLGQALSAPTSILKRPVAKLVADGALRTEGQRRGMKYFAGGGGKRKARKTRRKA